MIISLFFHSGKQRKFCTNGRRKLGISTTVCVQQNGCAAGELAAATFPPVALLSPTALGCNCSCETATDACNRHASRLRVHANPRGGECCCSICWATAPTSCCCGSFAIAIIIAASTVCCAPTTPAHWCVILLIIYICKINCEKSDPPLFTEITSRPAAIF